MYSQTYDYHKKGKKVQNCRNCLIIRYFLFAVLFLVIVGLVFTDKIHYLAIIKPYYLAYLILIMGFLIFLLKLYQYFKKLSITNKSHVIGDISGKPSKSMSRKKVD